MMMMMMIILIIIIIIILMTITTATEMRYLFFWDVTQHRLIVPTYQFHHLGSSSPGPTLPLKMDQ
jgi:uncharacterized integral membrane protein